MKAIKFIALKMVKLLQEHVESKTRALREPQNLDADEQDPFADIEEEMKLIHNAIVFIIYTTVCYIHIATCKLL